MTHSALPPRRSYDPITSQIRWTS